jgi:hypothetical protein
MLQIGSRVKVKVELMERLGFPTDVQGVITEHVNKEDDVWEWRIQFDKQENEESNNWLYWFDSDELEEIIQ